MTNKVLILGCNSELYLGKNECTCIILDRNTNDKSLLCTLLLLIFLIVLLNDNLMLTFDVDCFTGGLDNCVKLWDITKVIKETDKDMDASIPSSLSVYVYSTWLSYMILCPNKNSLASTYLLYNCTFMFHIIKTTININPNQLLRPPIVWVLKCLFQCHWS